MSTATTSNGAVEAQIPKKKSAVQWWKHPSAKRVGAASGVVLLSGVLLWAVFFRPYVTTDDARVAATLIRVAPESVGGKVIKVLAKEGDRLKKDDVVVEIDHTVFEANLRKAKAKAEQTQREFHRMEILASQNGVSSRDLENARAQNETAQANLTLAQTAYDRTFLKSPVDGVVVQKVAEVGNILEPGQTALTVADIDHAWIDANIEETAVRDVKPGQEVSISVDEGGDLRGKVSNVRVATASQFALIQTENPSGNFTKLVQRIPIKIELYPHDQVLRAGQSVSIRIRVK
jgi:membrane fusion protein (multidrug efflux system)